jgi:hypothetical protein
MRPTLPPAPPIRQPYWHGGHTLTVDDFSYGIGMLAALAVAGTSACAAGAILHAQTCHVQAAPGLQVPSARQAPTSTGDRKGLPMSRRRACQPPKQAPVRSTFRRKITSATTLRNMHVTKAMAERLSLHWHWPEVGVSGSQRVSRLAEGEADLRPGGQGQVIAFGDDRYPVFRHAMTLRDSAGCTWPVVYEAFISNRQYHRRLSDGWGAFCRHHSVKLNDTIEFRRCLTPVNVDSLAVRVLRGAGK